MSQYYPLICWKLDVGSSGFKVEFETSPSVWTVETTGTGTTNDVYHSAGTFSFTAGQERYAAYFDGDVDIFTALHYALLVRLVADGLATGVTISEIETSDDAFLRGGMPARRLRLKLTGPGEFTRWRITTPGGGVANILGALGGVNGATNTSDTDMQITLPYAYDGAFFLPAFHTHDVRATPVAVASVRTIQEVQSSVVVRRKSNKLEIGWRAVPAALVKNDGRYFDDSRERSGVAEAEGYACFENFWHACMLGSKQALVFRDASPGELDCSTCADLVYVDFASEDALDMGNLLTELHMEMGYESYDIKIMGKVQSATRLRLT